MSWMDWGSRPKKSAATPPPLYLVQEKVPYCHTCGRVIGSRKSQSAKATSSEVKYCSDRCKRNKLRPLDRRIEATFAALLDGLDASTILDSTSEPSGTANEADKTKPQPKDAPSKHQTNKKKNKTKGDPRIIIDCDTIEELVFGSRADPEKTFGRKKNRARRGVPDGEVWKSVDMEGSDTEGGSISSVKGGSGGDETAGAGSVGTASDAEEVTAANAVTDDGGVKLLPRVRPPQSQSDVNGSIGGEKGWSERIEETPEMLLKRREGQKRAEEREMVRCAARRAVVFGLLPQGVNAAEGTGKKDEGGKRLCEALMNGAVVEPSYAKGNWSIRWREE